MNAPLPEPGHVYLVGAGPGDPGLLSRRAGELLACADVVVYDYLVCVSLLDGCRDDCERIYVGKQPGFHAKPQAEIEEIITDRALAGKTVVRLKGGDPFVFGRGGEEVRRLLEKGIPFEVVPGVGGARKKALLHHFGSARGVADAGLSDLEAVEGISAALARKIYDHFHEND